MLLNLYQLHRFRFINESILKPILAQSSSSTESTSSIINVNVFVFSIDLINTESTVEDGCWWLSNFSQENSNTTNNIIWLLIRIVYLILKV